MLRVHDRIESNLDEVAALRRHAEALYQEARDFIEMTEVNVATSRNLISRAEELIRDMCERVNSTRDRLTSQSPGRGTPRARRMLPRGPPVPRLTTLPPG